MNSQAVSNKDNLIVTPETSGLVAYYQNASFQKNSWCSGHLFLQMAGGERVSLGIVSSFVITTKDKY